MKGDEFLRSLFGGDFGVSCAVGPWALTRDGYSEARIDGRKWKVARYVYERMRGPIPAGMVVSHTCLNRACVNPFHLELLTIQESTRRGQERRQRPTHCKMGHPFDEKNTRVQRTGIRVCRKCRNARSRNHVLSKRNVDRLDITLVREARAESDECIPLAQVKDELAL